MEREERMSQCRRGLRKSENQPSSQEVLEYVKTLLLLVRSVRQRKGANDPHKSGGGRRGPRNHPHLAIASRSTTLMADQVSNPIFMKGEAKYGLTLAMAGPGRGNAAPLIAKRVVAWVWIAWAVEWPR